MMVDVIEGDNIYIEYTQAKIVRGNTIVIGPGCNIELVEYKNNYTKDKESTVIENRKVEN